jgi:hypothetical protein
MPMMEPPTNTDMSENESTTPTPVNEKAEERLTSRNLFDAVARLQGLADRWNETQEWHNPPFLDGRIHISTGDLRDIATVCREIRASNAKRIRATD